MLNTALKSVWENDMRATATDSDWYDDHNLLHCGKCGALKETIINTAVMQTKRGWCVRPVACQCFNEEKKDTLKDLRREKCFDYPDMLAYTFAADDRADIETTKVARNYADNLKAMKAAETGLLFYGAPGFGKTFIAACVANEALENGFKVRFSSVATLAQRMTANYGDERGAILEELANQDLVVLDDLGKERETPTMAEHLYQIVNTLYESHVLMIYTTNHNLSELLDYSSPIYSRIMERCRLVHVKGKNRRKN